jgi:hypothetical protein
MCLHPLYYSTMWDSTKSCERELYYSASVLSFFKQFSPLEYNCTLENDLTYRVVIDFCGTLPSDPPNFIKLLFSSGLILNSSSLFET